MTWTDVLKATAEDDLDKLMLEYKKKKEELDAEFMEQYEELRERLFEEAPKGVMSGKNLRRKHPHTRRKRKPVDIGSPSRTVDMNYEEEA